MTNLDSILKSRDITLLTKVHVVKTMVFPLVMYKCESWTKMKASVQFSPVTQSCPTLCNPMNCSTWKPSTKELMLLNCGVGEDSWESLGLQRDPPSPSWRKSFLTIHWKDWCWSWSSNTLATWCKETDSLEKTMMLGKTEGRRRRGRQRMGWWMASSTRWTWVWVSSGSWRWTGRPGVL